MEYVPLTSLWASNGLAAIVFGCLQDAGFHPIVESDLRGPMHFFRWPLGSQRPLTIWIPAAEQEEASAFLAAPVDESWTESDFVSDGFWGSLPRIDPRSTSCGLS